MINANNNKNLFALSLFSNNNGLVLNYNNNNYSVKTPSRLYLEYRAKELQVFTLMASKKNILFTLKLNFDNYSCKIGEEAIFNTEAKAYTTNLFKFNLIKATR